MAKSMQELLEERDRILSSGNSSEQQNEKNKGGFLGGMEYLGTKLVDGAVSNIEGIVDFGVGGISYLIGLMGSENAAEYSKEVFENDWYNYNRADEKYNPGKGMDVLGDIVGVVGGAVPDVAIGLATGGLGLGGKLIGKGVSLATSFASTAGRGLNEAVNTTGELGAKEWAGGVGSGGIAAGIEALSGALGALAGGIFGKTGVEMGSELTESFGKKLSTESIGSIFGKAAGKEAAGEFGESAAGRLLSKIWTSKAGREILGEMASEGIEEGFESWLEPEIIQGTYNPEAPDATFGDVLYSAFLGGVGGGLVSGGVNTVKSTVNTTRGAKLSQDATKLQKLLNNAQIITNYESEKNTGSAVFEAVSELYGKVSKSIASSNGRYTLSQMNDIGQLEALVSSAVLQPSAVNAAKGIAQNAESTAEALNKFYKKTGQDRNITAEDLTAGLKLDGSSQEFVNSVTKALQTNSTLREVVINNMLGRMEFDARNYADSIFGDTKISTIATQQNLNRFLAGADAETLNQVGEALGVENWANITPDELAQKLVQFRESGASKAYEGGVLAVKKAQATTAYTNGMPSSISTLKNGVTRFKSEGADFGIVREGNTFRLYDYETGHITKAISQGEMEALVQRIKDRQISFKEESEMQTLDRELDAFAQENVPEYKNLTESEREAVRQTLRYAKANGISIKDQILFARIAAKSGMNIIVRPSLKADDAFFDGRNTIYIDASAPRTRAYSALLGHEMWHKMFKSNKAKGLFMQAWDNIDRTKRDDTIRQYMAEEQKRGRSREQSAMVSAEEVAAAYAEELFNFPDVWDFVLDGEPTLKDRVLDFFKGSPRRYSFASEMDPAARAWLREYKKLFDEVARLNSGENAAQNVGASETVKGIERIGRLVDENSELDNSPKTVTRIGKVVENAQKESLTSIDQENMQVSDERSAINSNAYDFKKPFYQQIEDYKNGKFPKTDSLILGQTPEAFQKIGLNPLPMTINQKHVDYVINGSKNADHQIGEIVLKYLPTALKNPVAIISSATANSTSLVAIISITHNGNQIIAPVYIDGAGRQNGIVIDCNAIASVYSRKNSISKLLADALADEANGKIGIYYWDKKRALALLSGEKVTMPNSLNTLSDGSIHSILEKGSPVKQKIKNITESQQFKRWFGDWQNHSDKSSKVVNDDGTPKILYHQTGEDFTVFDPRHKGSGSNDDGTPFGIFMKPDSNDIGLKGKKQMALYARIVNPLVVADRGQLEYELKRMSPEYAEIMKQQKALTAEYQKKLEDAEKAWNQYAKDYRVEHPEATRSEIYNDKTFSKLFDAEDILTEEWIEKADKISAKAKDEITKTLKEKGYDGVILKKDEGSGGRTVETYIALEPNQVKSATDNIGTFSKNEDDIRYALSDSKKATSTDVAKAKGAISEMNIDPRGIMTVADSYFDRYDGSLTRTGLRYEFLDAARTMLGSESDAYDRAFVKIEALADELTYNEKQTGGFADDLKEIQRHIREITFTVRDQDKGEFDSLGGFNEFRKKHFGKLKIGNEGASVDSIYGELQTLYGLSLFPDLNTAQEMLIRIADVVDMDPTVQTESDIDLEAARNEMAVDITQKMIASFDNKLAEKTARTSKADADAYKSRINARAESRVAKAIARAKSSLEKSEAKIKAEAEKRIADAERKADKRIETEKAKLEADYLTDKVFSQTAVNKTLGTVDAFKSLPSNVRSELSRGVWLEMSRSDGAEWRRAVEIEQTVKICNEIMRDPNSGYDTSSVLDRRRLNEEISKAMRQIAESGRKSTKAKLEGELREEIKTEESARRVYLSEIYQELKKIDDVKSNRFTAASDYKGRTFKGSIESLTKMDWRGQLNDNIVRSEMGKLAEWYTKDNPMLQGFKHGDLETTSFDQGVANRLSILAEGEGNLDNTELGMLRDTLKYFTKLIGEYDMVYVEGKWQSGEDLVYKMRDTIESQDKMGVPMAIRALRNKLLSGGIRTFGDPLSVLKICDMYEDGIFTKTYNDWMQGEINAEGDSLLLKEEYDAFMKKNRFYLMTAEKNTVKLHDTEINHLQLIEYLMTLKRKGSWLGVASEGVVFTDKKGRDVPMRPIAPILEGRGMNKRLEAAIKSEYDMAARLLTAKDKAYMEILERGYEGAKEIKAAGDMKRLGFVNVVDGYYYPIKRAYTEHLSEFESELFAVDRYANASFNKKTIEKAKSALRIGSADATFQRHVRGVTRYLHLSPVMDSFNKLYKYKALKTKPGLGADISALMKLKGSTFSLQSLIAQSRTAWREGDKVIGFDYLQNLMLDTMGRTKAVGDDIAGRFRSGYVGFALGGNAKVILTQFSSLLASTSILNKRSHLAGAFLWKRGMDNYSIVAKLRDSDYTVAKAQGVVDNISATSKFFTLGMSYADRFVVYRAWAACQAQVAQKNGPKIGTEENLIAAGKLLDKVILETQQNAFASRKTEGARRGNTLTKTMLMFKSDAITTHGRVIDAWGETAYLQAKMKNAAESESEGLKKQIKASKKKLKRSIGAVAMSSAYMVLVAELFSKFYGKSDDDETEEEKQFRRLGEFIGNLLGGMPVFSEIYSTLTSGYDLNSMEFSAINDLLSTSMDVIEYAEKLIAGTTTERDGNRLIEKMFYGVGQLFGIPFRNIKNLTYGFMRILDPQLAYKWNASLYSQSYSSNLKDALESGDQLTASTILELAFGEKIGSGLSKTTIDELIRLSGLGEKLIPSAIGDSITVDGEERTLTGKEISAVREKYSEAVELVNGFIGTDLYMSYDDEQKADAIRNIYTLYKNLAYDSVLGTKKDEDAYILSKIVDADVLCVYETMSVLKSDKDENGDTVAGSKREKVLDAIGELDITDEERLLLIAMKGYALKDDDIPGVTSYEAKIRLYNYIGELDVSDEERLALYDACDFKIKDGEAEPPERETSSKGSSSGSASLKKGSVSLLSGGILTNRNGTLANAVKKKVIKIGKVT